MTVLTLHHIRGRTPSNAVTQAAITYPRVFPSYSAIRILRHCKTIPKRLSRSDAKNVSTAVSGKVVVVEDSNRSDWQKE